MNEDAESMFSLGSIVFVETGWNHCFEGEVIAFDYKRKLLLLKCHAGNEARNDVHLINLDCVKNVKIKKEVKKEDQNQNNLPHLDFKKVNQRANIAINERKRLANAFEAGINEEGIKLFLHLSKTFNKVTWEGKSIIVMSNVLINYPYKADNCIVNTGHNVNGKEHKLINKSNDAVSYVKQLVDRYWNENSILN